MVSEQPTGQAAEDKKSAAVPEKFSGLVAEIEKLSVLELSELVKVLEDKFGVSAQAPIMSAPTAAGAAGAEAAGAEEKTSFSVELTSAGPNKISAIKAVREITEKGLKEAKDIVEAAPKIIKEGVAKEEAEEIKKKLEAAGSAVTLK